MLCLKQENLNGQYGSLNEKKKMTKKKAKTKKEVMRPSCPQVSLTNFSLD